MSENWRSLECLANDLIATGHRPKALRILTQALRKDLENLALHWVFLKIGMVGVDTAGQAEVLACWAGIIGQPIDQAVSYFVARHGAEHHPGHFFDYIMPLLALGQLAVGRPLDAIETRTLATWDPVEIEPKQHLIDIGAVYRFIAKDYDAGHNRQRARHFAAFLDTHADGSVGSVLDLCCGTGLLGPTLRRRARHLTGIDLSAEMLNRVPPGLYDDLYQTDAATFLRDSQNSFDLIIVANVMPYFRDAAAIINLLARRLNGNGCCALVIDACADRYDVRSTSGGVRNQKADYCHSIRYLTASAAAAGRSVHRCIVSEYRTCPGAYFIL